MAIPTPATWSTIEVPTASKMNSGIRDPALFAINPPAALLKKTNAQTWTNNVAALIIWNVETLDNASMVNLGTNATRITITESGLYAIGAAMTWANNSTGGRILELRVNGVAIAQDRRGASTATALSPATTELLVPGDYVEANAAQDSGGSLGIFAGTTPRLWVVRVSG